MAPIPQYKCIKSVFSIPYAYTALYVNYASIKKIVSINKYLIKHEKEFLRHRSSGRNHTKILYIMPYDI